MVHLTGRVIGYVFDSCCHCLFSISCDSDALPVLTPANFIEARVCIQTLRCLRLKCDSVILLRCDNTLLHHSMGSEKRTHPITGHEEHIKIRRRVELSDAMSALPEWCHWEMISSHVWLDICKCLPPSAVCNLVCACHKFGADAVLASKVFILCSDAALRVFHFVKGDMRDNVAGYICGAEKRMSSSDGKLTFEKLTFDKVGIRYALYLDEMEECWDSVEPLCRHGFDPDHVIDEWDAMGACADDKYD